MTTGEDKIYNSAAKNPETMKIPAFLNCTLIANATTVLYDNLT
jgi:hypothetical protein